MHAIIDAAFDRARTALLLLLFALSAGSVAWLAIPKEAEPDVPIPIIYVSMNHDGISPEDADRLLVRPMENALQGLEGVKRMSSTASEGHASVLMEYDAGFDNSRALDEVREKVDTARSELPASSDEPTVNEVNVALFPVITVSLSGPIAEPQLLGIARRLRDHMEALTGVLEVDIGGEREELLEIVVEPIVMETYAIRYGELFSLVANNNLLVAAGALDTGAGRLVLKVPGVVEELDDVLRMPVKVVGDTVITFADVATLRRTYKDATGFARIDGEAAVTLEVKKRIGANIIETNAAIRAILAEAQKEFPPGLEVRFLQDKSKDIVDMLGDLQNNVLTAILLVMIVVIAALGVRSALLVGLAIPGAFLSGVLALYAMGHTLNIVVLFSLILVVGMLVDGAIVVIELADRNLAAGQPRRLAFAAAAKRMSWPVTASTLTTLAVFFPLLFWPGVVGHFMKYLPITVIVCLTASLAMALVFVPVLGGSVGRRSDRTAGRRGAAVPLSTGKASTAMTTGAKAAGAKAAGAGVPAVPSPAASGSGVPGAAAGHDLPRGRFVRGYVRWLSLLLRRPLATLGVALLAMFATYASYYQFGRGVEFFPDVEPSFAQLQIHARGDLSIREKDAVLRRVESRLLDVDGVRVLYARSFAGSGGHGMAEDVIAVIQFEFEDWQLRPNADEIIAEMRARTADLPGVLLEFRKAEEGPGGGKPIELRLSSTEHDLLPEGVAEIRRRMAAMGGFVDIEDDRALPGIEWRLEVDREAAARYGADVATLGTAVRMLTGGILLTEYRPEDADDVVDIRARFPFEQRNLDQLRHLRVQTSRGMVPIGNFVGLVPAPRTGTLKRVDTKRTLTVKADVAEGVLADDKVRELRQSLSDKPLDARIEAGFGGQDEDQRETMVFLAQAFIAAVFLMLLMLVTQFNSIYQALLVMSAIVFSTAGVLIGLMVTAQPFGIVMVGLGIIALAGIVVNNNIVLIDTFNQLRRDEGLSAQAAALKSGALRLRPVLLTAITTVLGLMPMVLALNIDLIGREITVGAPSTQWWTQLSSAIAGGLAFATLLTLLLTPCMLVLGERLFAARRSRSRTESPSRSAAAPAQ